jgi:hypothetical protein
MKLTELTQRRETLGRRVGIAAIAGIVILLVIWTGIALQPKPAVQIDTGTASISIGSDGVSVKTEPGAN